MDMDEADALSARIFKDFRNILTKPLDEYDIIPDEEQLVNKCPLILIDRKLAIKSWCLPSLFQYATGQMFKQSNETNPELDDITRVVLMLNPEYATAWNVRRRLSLPKEAADTMEELKFSELLLKRKPKSSDNFSYRQFLLRRVQAVAEITQQMIDNELRVCTEAASDYHRNYYAWSHRIWIMENLVTWSVPVMRQELESVKNWIQCHVSEYSAFHYRQVLLLKLKSLCISFNECIFSEVSMLDHLFETFPDRESLFLHRRFVLMLSGDAPAETEKKFIESQKQAAKHNEWHVFLIERHEKWLSKFLEDPTRLRIVI